MSSTAGSATTAAQADAQADAVVASPSPSARGDVDAKTQPQQQPEPEPPLPPLKPHEFRAYNRMAEKMEYYHNHFRQMWNSLHGACSAGRRPAGVSLRAFIEEGIYFCHGLEMHHGIEEKHVFPRLARRMPEFQTPSAAQLRVINDKKCTAAPMDEKRARLVLHHRLIHAGIEELETYLTACRDGERELEMGVMLAKMNSWGAVLWEHLDEEVKTLGAENMRKYWSLEEMRNMPF